MWKCRSLESLIKVVDRLRNALAETFIPEPTPETRIKEFSDNMVGRAFYLPEERNGMMNPTIFFVTEVKQDLAHKDLMYVSGVRYHISNAVYPYFIKLSIRETFIREHTIRVHNADGTIGIWNAVGSKDTMDYKKEAKRIISKMSKALDSF